VLVAAGLGLELSDRSTVPVQPRQLAIDNPYQGGNWFKGNLDVASVRGLGRDLPSAIGGWYATRGYSFLGISDVNTYTWTSEYASAGLTGVPVVDARYTFGDLLAVGDDGWLPASNAAQAAGWISADGALPVVQAINGSPLPHGLFGLEIANAAHPQASPTALWDQLLTSGDHVYAFGGDGIASLDDPVAGTAWIVVQATSSNLDLLLSSLRRGAFYASTGPAFTRISVDKRIITVAASPGTRLRFIGAGGRLLESSDTSTASYKISGNEKYVRVEAVAPDGTRAWSQPLFLTWR
jgi:hypothetical protein